jgi:hypothetical protein
VAKSVRTLGSAPKTRRRYAHAVHAADDPQGVREGSAWRHAGGKGGGRHDEVQRVLQAAGVLLTLDGLHPPSMGARISFPGGKPQVIDGPFIETKEVLGGYWMIQVKSKEEAVAWASRCPASDNEIIEVRQVQEFSDFPVDVQEAAAKFPELQAQSRQHKGS